MINPSLRLSLAAINPKLQAPCPPLFRNIPYPEILRQLTGIHINARCTCGAKLKGTGPDQSAALADLWNAFKNHQRSTTTK